MHEKIEKAKENKSRSSSASVTQAKNKGSQSFDFVDNRPVAVVQRLFNDNNARHVVQRSINLSKANPVTISRDEFLKLQRLILDYNRNNSNKQLLDDIAHELEHFKSDEAFYQDIKKQLATELNRSEQDFNFNQMVFLDAGVCYGLSMEWIKQRYKFGLDGSERFTSGKELEGVLTNAWLTQSAYITDDSGQGPILDYSNENMKDLKENYGLSDSAESGQESGTSLTYRDVWEKDMLYQARKRKHIKELNPEGGLQRLPATVALHNFKRKDAEKNIGYVGDFLNTLLKRSVIIILEGTKGGHAIAAETLDKKTITYFDPDFGQRSGDGISGIINRIKELDTLLDLNSIQLEFFNAPGEMKQ